MNDAELAEYLGIADCDQAKVARYIAAMPPTKRATYERMHEVETALIIWQAGVGPKPTGVIVSYAKRRAAPGAG